MSAPHHQPVGRNPTSLLPRVWCEVLWNNLMVLAILLLAIPKINPVLDRIRTSSDATHQLKQKTFYIQMDEAVEFF